MNVSPEQRDALAGDLDHHIAAWEYAMQNHRGMPGDPGPLADFLANWLAGVVRAAQADAWDEGYEGAARFYEGKKGHWENNHPREGLRTWIPEPAPDNPYREGSK